MKTITIGDVHGRSYWERVDLEKYDKVIFVGDIMDNSRQPIEDHEMLQNTKKILKLKEENPDKVILIPGNHDLPYIFSYDFSPCSRFRKNMYERVHELYVQNKHLFQAAFQHGSYLWTHGGVLRGWYEVSIGPFNPGDEKKLAETINERFRNKPRLTISASTMRGGYDLYGGPFWAHVTELVQEKNPLPINQIVGHNRMENIITHKRRGGTWTITFTDVQDWKNEFFELEIPD